jgi:hypothetical protein
MVAEEHKRRVRSKKHCRKRLAMLNQNGKG